MPKLAANLSLMFTEVNFLDRFAAVDGGLQRRRVPLSL
jgi:hydroxypyruvate isomerase